jgi:enoyl-CoA hydratase/carnithine racemase
MESGLKVDTDGGIVRLTLIRPERRNTLTRAVCAALRDALAAAAADPGCRAVVIQGTGGAFASGADLVELNELRGQRERLLAAYRELRATQELLYRLERPTVAAIDGHCLGAGLSLALACDLCIATPGSRFSAPPARLGLMYSTAEIRRLVQRIGTARTRDLLFTGRWVDGVEAASIGLIERLCAPAELDARVRDHLEQIAACSPGAIRNAKRQLLALEEGGVSSTRDDLLAEEAFFEPDGTEGMAAFVERRRPRFAP